MHFRAKQGKREPEQVLCTAEYTPAAWLPNRIVYGEKNCSIHTFPMQCQRGSIKNVHLK